MSIEFINKPVSIWELVLKDILIFLAKIYFKLVLGDFQNIYHCKIDLCNVHIKEHSICTKIKIILKSLKLLDLVLLKMLRTQALVLLYIVLLEFWPGVNRRLLRNIRLISSRSILSIGVIVYRDNTRA